MSSNLLNEHEVAERLGIAVATLRVWRSTRRYNLRYIKIGRCCPYRPEDVEKFIEAQTIKNDQVR